MTQLFKSPKDRLHLLKRLAGRCSAVVKQDSPDMRECHSAAIAMVNVLRLKGFDNSRVLGCSAVILANSGGTGTGVGDTTAEENEPAHYVVLADGNLIDLTAGQFRALGIAIPDYLIIPAKFATEMLEANRRWVKENGNKLFMVGVRNCSYDYKIAYVPTDKLA